MLPIIQSALRHKDVLWSLAFNLLRMGSGVLVLPIALRTIPTAEMGIYYTFMSLTAFAMLLDFGMVGTIGRSAAYAWGGAANFSARGIPEYHGGKEPNRPLLASLTHVVRFWYTMIALVALLLLSGAGTWFIGQRIDEAGFGPDMLWCWLFFSGVTAFSLGASYWNVLLMGIGDVTNVGRFGFVSQLISTILLLAGLLLGFKLWAYAVSLLIGPAINRYLSRRRYLQLVGQPLPPWFSAPDFHILTTLWPMTWRMGVVILGDFLISRGSILVASACLGLQTTAKYGLSMNLFSILFQLSGVALFAANPRIAQARVQRDTRKVRKLFFPRAYGGLAVASLGAVSLLFIGNTLLDLVGSQTQMLPSGYAGVLFLIMLLDRHQNYYANLVMAANENPFVIPTILSGTLMFGLAILFTPKWGLTGLLLSHAVVQLAWNHWWPVVRGLKTLRIQPDQEIPATRVNHIDYSTTSSSS